MWKFATVSHFPTPHLLDASQEKMLKGEMDLNILLSRVCVCARLQV